jgi:hypothetical protein
VSRQLRIEGLRPILNAFGIGDSTLYWTYSSFEDQPVVPGAKYNLIILDVPQGNKTVDANISYEVVKANKRFGVWEDKNASSDEYSIRWDLNTAKPFLGT